MAYCCWILSLFIIGEYRIFALPVVASFLMVAWDLSMEPVWATIDKAWIWYGGGPYFGVPLSNVFGWYLTAYIFYQLFALSLGNKEPRAQTLAHWRLPVILCASSAAGNLLLALALPFAKPTDLILHDDSSHRWLSQDTIANCVLVSLFVMVPFAAIAWVRSAKAAFLQCRPT